MMERLRACLLLVVVGLATAGLTGCNTMEGAGEDIEEGGGELEEEAGD